MALGDCRYDPVRFADEHVGVELHEGQKRYLREAYKFDADGSLHYRFPNLTASNRWGKTVLVAVTHLWFAVFKHGLHIEGEDWFSHPYSVINLCPLVDLANITRDMVNDLLQNKAKEQIMRPGGRGYSDLGPLFVRGDDGYLVTFGDYKGFRTKLTNATLEYRTSSDNAKALQGKRFHYLTFDEAGRQKAFQQLMGAHVVPRTLDTGGVVATFSTPDVDTATDYEEWCKKGDPENYFRDPLFYWYRGTIRENPHITEEQIRKLTAGVPLYMLPQVLDGKFVQSAEAFFSKESLDRAFRADLKPSLERENGHQYIISADLAVVTAGDRSVFTVIDITSPPFIVKRIIEPRRGTAHPLLIEDMKALLEFYNGEWVNPQTGQTERCEAELVFDSTGLGGKMFKAELMSLWPTPRGYDFGGVTAKKLNILASLRFLIDKELLLIPAEYGAAKQEMKDYAREDAKLRTDTVMSLSLGAYLAERTLPVQVDEDGWQESIY